MRSFKLALGFVLMASAAAAQSYPSSTFNSLSLPTTPSISYSYGGVDTLNNILLNAPGNNASKAQSPLTSVIVSTAGNADVLGRYKAGFQVLSSAQSDSASIWGGIMAASVESNFTGTNPIGAITLELDLNNSKIAASGFGTPNTFNLFLTGAVASASYWNQGFICMCYSGANPLANYGIVAWDNAGVLTKIADFHSQSHSPVAYSDSGTHTTGLKLFGTYSSNAIDVNSAFTVTGSGGLNAASVNVNTASNGYYLASVHALWYDGTYVNVGNNAGGSALLLRSTASYFSTDNFTFRNSAGSTNYATLTAGGFSSNVPIVVPNITTGTPVASLCLDASNNIIKKTTSGACI